MTNLERINLETPLPKTESDAQAKLIQEKGFKHETAYLNTLKKNGLKIADLSKAGGTLEEKVRATLEAMRSGVDIVYQAALLSENRVGYADFLRRVDTPSTLGAHSYEVVDTKLARSEKAKFILQLCFYSDLLTDAQGVEPRGMHLVLGDGTEQHFRVADFSRYYRNVKARFFAHLKSDPNASYPEWCTYCSMCRRSDLCEGRWLKDDHLNQVAEINRRQVKLLQESDIRTMEKLAELPAETKIGGMKPEALLKLKKQAGLQRWKQTKGENKFFVMEPDRDRQRGFFRLPEPNEGDLFFDMEGDPLEPGGHEYLFGVCYLEERELRFKDFWAREKTDERKAFEDFIDFAMDRLRKFPQMHIYHYANYEESAIKRLMSVYGTREAEVDQLLRNKILVDLYKVVRENIMVSEPRYSIKNLEAFYMNKRKDEVKTAGDSIVYFNEWRETGDENKLKLIRDYNEVDCRSTYHLREWLLTIRPDGLPWFQPEQRTDEADENIQAAERRLRQYEADLLRGTPDDRQAWTNKDHARELVSQLLEFHRREAKSTWWKLFELKEKNHVELMEEPEAIGGMKLMGSEPIPKPARSFIYTYQFPEQEFKMSQGKACLSGSDKFEELEITEISESSRLVKIKSGKKLPEIISLIPPKPIDSKVIRDAVYRFADSVIAGDGKYACLQSFLEKELPRIAGRQAKTPIVASVNPAIPEVVGAVAGMERTYLFVQGPPGAGKTYTGSHVIAELLRRKKKVGISSNSHKAINNLLERVEEVAKELGVTFKGVKKISGEEDAFRGSFIRSEKDNAKILADDPDLVAGTAWLFSRQEHDQRLDYLFVDEAGQVSLANLIGMGTSAKNIVLLGDQMQLSQPIQGVHPGKSGLSALDYLLEEIATIPPERGIFLGTTRRMHKDVCEFISEAVYDGKLQPEPQNQSQRLVLTQDAHPLLKPTGIVYVKAEHVDCKQCSKEEAEIVAQLFSSLLKQWYIDKNGKGQLMTLADILVVSPYNMQVNLLKKTLPPGAKVGTIDKFQGQEAQAVIVSMATSSGEDLPREIEFLYSKNRLNVAISRAKCLAILVANPNLLTIKCNSVEQMELVNTLCWVEEYAAQPHH